MTGLSLQDFFDSTSGKFKTQPVQAVVDALLAKRNLRRQVQQEERNDGFTAGGNASGGSRAAHTDQGSASKRTRVDEDS